METTEKIKPIINGSSNPRYTLELFKALSVEEKKQIIWNKYINLLSAHSYPDIDYVCFKAPDFELKYSDTQLLNSDEFDLLFENINEIYKKNHTETKRKTAAHHFKLGENIHKVQSELGFGGIIELSVNRLRGYIAANGSWNEFNSSRVAAAVNTINSQVPRVDYGINNVNTGNAMHVWKTISGCAYIFLEFSFVDSKTLDKIKEFYHIWEREGRNAKADSIRHEITDHGNGYFGIEFVWWWD
jgi:hypothetical protein